MDAGLGGGNAVYAAAGDAGGCSKLYVDPALPDWLPDVTLTDLRLGRHRFDSRFWPDGKDTLFKVLSVSARIGLDCGPVVIDSAGEMIGDAPNVAARVQTVGEPGSVLVTINVLRQVSGLFVTEERGESELVGMFEPVNLFSVVRASGGRRRAAARALTRFVGREEELGLLARQWSARRQAKVSPCWLSANRASANRDWWRSSA
jgi:hypothetical protein